MTLCVRVSKDKGEEVRSRLLSEGLMDLRFRIRADGPFLLIPVTSDPGGLELVEADLDGQERRSSDYRDVVSVPEELRPLLPSSFDVIGDVALIKIPDELAPYGRQMGEALVSANGSIRAVFSDSGVKGDFRIRDLERLAGSGGSETVHKEFGVRLFTDPAKVYFNPRLSSERARIASLVKDGEIIIDMFGGVAPFGTVICRLAHPEAVYSIDLNPEAERFAKMNAEKNHVDRLHPMTGDSSVLIYGLPMADRIIMNLPQIAERFLPHALARLKSGGTVHMYKIIERAEFDGFVDRMIVGMKALGHGIAVKWSELKTYSPTMSVYSLDIVKF
ncbi:MAG: class I SAM-dependent methyltransferase family protein [Candidatus Methanomethylophilaceae archaeon]|nr:class I SAM-dependent methyltransferase family protein [Candidatus Methanomethylophilaceae archaeon]